jgi:peptidoglycan hydrolase-like protein with peptidoglycan-binding domain
MLLSRASLAFLISAAVITAPAFANTTTTSSTHKKTSTTHAQSSSHSSKSTTAKKKNTSKKSSHKKKSHGQQGIDSARATEIQQALIREHYMTGEANGQWDATTEAAMRKFQADQGWQTKLMPDSRAIKKLGLGPDYSNAINASGSSFADPKPAADIPATSGFAAASGVNR